MGLDGVELVMEIEKAFEINIPDQEAEKIITVGDMYNCVWNHIQKWHSDKCNSQVLFYRLRNMLATMFGINKNLIRTDALLNSVFPKENRRINYSFFERNMELELPSLVLTKPWSMLLNGFGTITIGGGIIFAFLYSNFFNHSNWFYTIPLIGIILTTLLSLILNPKRTIISPDSIRPFIEKTLSLNVLKYAKERGLNRNEMEIVINNIISDKLGNDLDEIKPEKSFVDDLGVD